MSLHNWYATNTYLPDTPLLIKIAYPHHIKWLSHTVSLQSRKLIKTSHNPFKHPTYIFREFKHWLAMKRALAIRHGTVLSGVSLYSLPWNSNSWESLELTDPHFCEWTQCQFQWWSRLVLRKDCYARHMQWCWCHRCCTTTGHLLPVEVNREVVNYGKTISLDLLKQWV